MSTSRLDVVYRSLLLTRFFTQGWGKPEHMKAIFGLRRRVADREIALTFVDPNHEICIDKEVKHKTHRVLEGRFKTPVVDLLPGKII